MIVATLSLGPTIADPDAPRTYSPEGKQLRKKAQESTDQQRSVRAADVQQKMRAQQLFDYLASLVLDQHITARTAGDARRAWEQLVKEFGSRVPVPDVGAGPDGQILFSWNNDEHHFELEIMPEGIAEFFYLNMRTDKMWSLSYSVGNSLPNHVAEGLHPFLRNV